VIWPLAAHTIRRDVGATSKQQIKVLIVDDHRTFGEALRAALAQERDLDVVDVVTDGPSAVESASEHHPDVVLMDVSMPGVDGIEATRRIKEVDPEARVVMMTGHENELLLGKAVQAGASGYLGKTEAITIVAESVRVVYRGDALLDEAEVEQALRTLRHRRAQEGSIERRLDRLTPREVQILQRLAQGMSNEQIATDLGMSPHTLRTHIQNILTKLGVHSKLEALVFAIRHGKVAAAG
jgi:DNA-binding NarL/FixJ family response regulator